MVAQTWVKCDTNMAQNMWLLHDACVCCSLAPLPQLIMSDQKENGKTSPPLSSSSQPVGSWWWCRRIHWERPPRVVTCSDPPQLRTLLKCCRQRWACRSLASWTRSACVARLRPAGCGTTSSKRASRFGGNSVCWSEPSVRGRWTVIGETACPGRSVHADLH